ncbi:T9SS type A sorting domain-containing protein [candidate division WOR-3 bacterium]|nr:T9SS type A sorting domain-containing protein [candidate division WOR-3 bacterium]
MKKVFLLSLMIVLLVSMSFAADLQTGKYSNAGKFEGTPRPNMTPIDLGRAFITLHSQDWETSMAPWTHTNGLTFPNAWGRQASSTHSAWTPPDAGSWSMWIDSDDAGNGVYVEDTAMSPAIEIAGNNDIFVKWGIGFNQISTDEIMQMMYRECSGGIWGAWTVGKSYTADFGPAWDSLSISTTADSLQVGFYYDNLNNWAWYVAIDNVSIGYFEILTNDIALESIDEPATATVPPGVPFTPTVTIENVGGSPEVGFWTYYKIADGVGADVYFDSILVDVPDTLFPDSTRQLVMPSSFTPPVDNYTATAYTALIGDGNTSNDTMDMAFAATFMGWNNEDVTGTTPVQWAQSCTGGGKLWVIGGLDATKGLSSVVQCYEPGVGWTTLTSIPVGSWGGACAYINDKIYVIGGLDAGFTAVNRTAIYDVLTDTWSTGTAPPDARGGVGGAVVDSKIYIVGGSTSSSFPTDCPNYEYDPSADTTGGIPWATKTACPRAGSGLIIGAPFMPTNGSPYVFVGGDYRGSAASYGYYAYDPAADSWVTLAQPPSDVGGMCPAMNHDGTNLYLFGGDPPGSWGAPYSDKIYYWDIGTDTWINCNAPMSSAYEPSASGIIDEKIYSFGGTTGSGPMAPPPFEWTYTATYTGIATNMKDKVSDNTIILCNLPNPLRNETTIRYEVSTEGRVNLSVYALTGQLVKTIVNENKKIGVYNTSWNGIDNSGRKVVSGVYIYKLTNGSRSVSNKMTIIR